MLITDQSKVDEYYEALINRDQQYIGVFFVGVTTTSVFCIATCRARKPKKENVVFYSDYSTALKNGYRPCKICSPTEIANTTPEKIELAIKLVKDNPKKKITDDMLRKHNISPDFTRRWFKKTYGITFHAFQRMYRVNNAYKELKDGKRMTDTAYESGYESLSGFAYTYKKVIGKSPSKSKTNNVILLNRLTTPLGPMFVAATADGVCLLEFTDRKMIETEFSDLQKRLDASILIGENEHITQLKNELNEYFEGHRQVFNVPLVTPGSDFQNEVWSCLRDISFGDTRSYQRIAIQIGKPNAVRAIGRANGLNKISIVIPCHRVIAKSGALTGYGGGINRKKWLLDFEQKISTQQA